MITNWHAQHQDPERTIHCNCIKIFNNKSMKNEENVKWWS